MPYLPLGADHQSAFFPLFPVPPCSMNEIPGKGGQKIS
jgi:hypothetical protein